MSERTVTKRDGRIQAVDACKVARRIAALCGGLEGTVDPDLVAKKVMAAAPNGLTTPELDTLAADTAAFMSTLHHNYSTLAARIAVSSLHKTTSDSFADTCLLLANFVHPVTRTASPLVAADVCSVVQDNRDVLDAAIVHARDFDFDYFGFRTMEKSYLMRLMDATGGRVVERPQYMFMRVAVGIHKKDIAAVLETYDLLSRRCFTHATPTLFNAGTPTPQMSSCFLTQIQDDSIDGIFDTLKTCACISKFAGGIGLSVHNVRATGSHIRGTNGSSNGIVPMLKVFSDTARYVDQGGGKRKGSIAVYLEPWHADVMDFLKLKKNHGAEEMRARDLFYALWVPDLFMERVQASGTWSLFCPNEAPGLADVWGAAFETLYTRYEAEGRARHVMPAQELWFAILEAQMESGTPYLMYKDACNRKSNHQHLGTIKSSNLCTEIVEFTSPDEVAVCNLASLSLAAFVNVEARSFDFDMLARVTAVAVRNLNKVIDINFYPVEAARLSNVRHRPIGLGVQGLADVFMMLRMPYDSAEAAALNRQIFEAMYFAALTTSCELAAANGPYETYHGSPVSRGVLQFDMWGVAPSDRHDWPALRRAIATHGVRNSLLVAPMPTASTAQILGNCESFEPLTSNIYSRRVLCGEFVVMNKHMVRDLEELGLWSKDLCNAIIAERGSIQAIAGIPDSIKKLYKTVWEISMKTVIDMARDRGAFIDQSQSLNLYMAEPTTSKLTSMHFYGWKAGLKTGQYYLRTKPRAQAIQFTVDQVAAARGTDTTSPFGLLSPFLPSPATEDGTAEPEHDGPACRRRKAGDAPLTAEECLVCSA